jgi:hypothetical protein
VRDLLISRTVASQHGHEREFDHQGKCIAVANVSMTFSTM